MLPELLFNVGSSMQDISRDDFGLLSGSGCDKDIRITSPLSSPPPPADTTYHSCADIPPVQSFSPNLDRVKIEESCSDLYGTPSWHHPHHSHAGDIGSTKLLLKNSDDPLISRGANIVCDDDNPNELNSIVAAAKAAASAAPNQTVPSDALSKSQRQPTAPKRNRNASTTGGTPRTRRKGPFKLRFHHQALPPEYLNHYEATLNQQNRVNNNNSTSNNKNISAATKKHQQPHENTQVKMAKSGSSSSHETVRSWLQQISETQQQQSFASVHGSIVTENRSEGQDDVVAAPSTAPVIARIHQQHQQQQRSPKRMVNYSDLPYMGEMTLENTKPRRGRKPKKADICHLIFKNYGTIFPGTPKDIVEEETKGLLEKRLVSAAKEPALKAFEEPLNLCLRDQSTDSLTISSDEENSEDLNQSNRTTPLTTASDPITDAILAANLKMSLPNFQSALIDKETGTGEETQTPSTGDSEKTSSSNYGYWPTGPGAGGDDGVFLHPMAMYYQKMMDAGFQPPATQPGTPPTARKSQSPKIFPKHLSKLIKKEKTEPPEPCSTPSSIRSSSSSTTTTTTTSLSTIPVIPPPQKRKRSAIFIPPIPAENTTNPATEVSICKFKFTGGAKPSLQEKKMLSVDSDGNYRYYSGTGDKSMRGYEFFPRESLQQSGLLPGSNSASAFLNATGERISQDLPPPSMGLSNELLQLPDSPNSSMLLSPSPSTASLFGPTHQMRGGQNTLGSGGGGGTMTVSCHQDSKDRRKRKSRRSLQREKLEQTFKEKGFLIQTQQLESAEGATYCKFRQLRKFTRYLFRSWKDHLPGELQHANAAVVAAAATASGKPPSALQKTLMETAASQHAVVDKDARHK